MKGEDRPKGSPPISEPPQLQVEIAVPDEATAVVRIAGEIDLHTSPQLRDCLAEACALETAQVAVDLRQTTFIDSAGMGVLLQAGRRLAARDAALSITCRGDYVGRALMITGFDRICTLCVLDY